MPNEELSGGRQTATKFVNSKKLREPIAAENGTALARPTSMIGYAASFILSGNMPAIHKEGSLRIVQLPHLKFGL